MSKSKADFTGRRFGKLKVIKRGENYKQRSTWDCVCDCGKDINIRLYQITRGSISSCGCQVLVPCSDCGVKLDKEKAVRPDGSTALCKTCAKYVDPIEPSEIRKCRRCKDETTNYFYCHKCHEFLEHSINLGEYIGPEDIKNCKYERLPQEPRFAGSIKNAKSNR